MAILYNPPGRFFLTEEPQFDESFINVVKTRFILNP